MNIWEILEWVAWGISALLLLWMMIDAIKVSARFREDFLLSSREGVDDLFGDAERRN